MTMTKTQAADAVQHQVAEITEAIALLTGSLNELTSTVSPDTDSWGDVGKFAHVAEMARGIAENYEEQLENSPAG